MSQKAKTKLSKSETKILIALDEKTPIKRHDCAERAGVAVGTVDSFTSRFPEYFKFDYALGFDRRGFQVALMHLRRSRRGTMAIIKMGLI